MSDISRRTFLTTTAAGAGLTILPRHVLGRGFQAPSDTVNIASDSGAWAAATRVAS
jgi:TAT (twin-arginine translocation) pathway signal sequence